MALDKRTKIGGAYFQGFRLIVSSAPGNYVLDMAQTGAAGINSLTVIPDQYGAGDTLTISHMNSDTTITKATLATNLYNMGRNVSQVFDFPALEDMRTGESLRLTYVNTASIAMNVYTLVEYIGIYR